MAAHRYWRVYFYSCQGSSIVTVHELEMFLTSGGVNQCTGGTPMSSSNYDWSWEESKAFDGVKNTDISWASSTSYVVSGQWLGYDFGAGNEKDITEFKMTSRQYSLEQSPRSFVLQFSDDNIEWFSLGTPFEVEAWSSNETRTFVPEIVSLFVPFRPLTKAFEFNNFSWMLGNVNPAAALVGEGFIEGTITLEGDPLNEAPVKLYDSLSGILVRETKTNILGKYLFTNLKSSREFDVVAEDPLKEWEKVVSSRRLPFTIPSFKLRAGVGEATAIKIIRPTLPYRYYKLNITANGSGDPFINIGVIRLTGGGTQNLCVAHGGTFTQSSSYDSAGDADKAFLETGGMWHTASQAAPWWAQWDFGAGNEQPIEEYSLTYSNCCNRWPTDFTLSGSNDGSSWTTIHTVTNENSWVLNQLKTFVF